MGTTLIVKSSLNLKLFTQKSRHNRSVRYCEQINITAGILNFNHTDHAGGSQIVTTNDYDCNQVNVSQALIPSDAIVM